MTEFKRKLILHGKLREEFGKEFNLGVDTVGHMLRVMEANFSNRFFTMLSQGDYSIILGEYDKQNYVDLDEVSIGLGNTREVHLMPAVTGAGGGGNKGGIVAILGIALLAAATAGAAAAGAAAFVPGAGLSAGGSAGLAFGATIGATGISYGTVAMLGGALLLSGISSLLAPQPKAASIQDRSSPENKPSLVFNGPVNAVTEGGPVPLVYGRLVVGSVVVQGSIIVEDIPV